MAFTMPAEPLALSPNQTGKAAEFPVRAGAEEMFIRVIALWTDNTALEGAAPTFQLQAPGGVITPVNAGAGNVQLSGEGGAAGTAACERLGGDIYLVTITSINEDVTGPGRIWRLRMRNNAAKALRFVWVSSDKERNTLQPWMVLGEPGAGLDSGPALMSMPHPSPGEFLTVSNWGTAPLEIRDSVNKPLGGPQSPAILDHRPAKIAPHGVDHMVIRREPIAAPPESISHAFQTNDEDPRHNKTLNIKVR